MLRPVPTSHGFSSDPPHTREQQPHSPSPPPLFCVCRVGWECSSDIALTSLMPVQRLDESAIDGVAEEIRGTVLPVLSDLFDDLLGVKLVRWCELQREGVHDDDDISDALGQLRARVERCTAALLEACRQLEKLHESSASPVLQEATEHAHQLLAAVIRKSTVFTAPPPQVLKTTNKFNVAVCCLAGNALELADMPIVTLSVLSEAQARDLHAAEAEGDDEAIGAIGGGKSTCGQLANNKAELSFDQTTNSIAARFRGMSLKSVKRSATKSDVAVTEEKFCVVAKLEVSVGGGSISVAAMSHPVVVIVHGMQQHNARATILWDSACALPHRVSYFSFCSRTQQVTQCLSCADTL